MLVVDADTTTELTLLQITTTQGQVTQMLSLHHTSGVGVGYDVIDRLFVRLTTQRTAAYPKVHHGLPPDYAIRLARSNKFQTLKRKFGERVYMSDKFKIPMEGVAHHVSHGAIGIENGRMVFSL